MKWMKNNRKAYPTEYKAQICEEYLSTNKTLEEMSHEKGVNVSTLSKWIGIYREYGREGFLKRGRKGITLDIQSETIAPILTKWDEMASKMKPNGKVQEDTLTRLKIMYAEEALEKQALIEYLKKNQ